MPFGVDSSWAENNRVKTLTLLQFDHVSKHYGDNRALNAVSFTVDSGEIVALLGANGSGKTTCIKSICSLIETDQGDIKVAGCNIRQSNHYLTGVGAVLEGARNVHWRLTTLQNAEYFSTLKGGDWKTCRTIARHFIDLLGLEHQLKMEVGKMSTGNRQKVAILCALLHEPQLALLDEPTIGLDVDTVGQLKKFIVEQSKSQGFLITSHDLNFIDEICDRVIVLSEGEKVFDGSLAKLKQLVHQFELNLEVAGVLNSSLRAKLGQVIDEDNVAIRWKENSLHIRFNNAATGMQVVAKASEAGIDATHLEIKSTSMEQAYKELVKGDENVQ